MPTNHSLKEEIHEDLIHISNSYENLYLPTYSAHGLIEEQDEFLDTKSGTFVSLKQNIYLITEDEKSSIDNKYLKELMDINDLKYVEDTKIVEDVQIVTNTIKTMQINTQID